MVRRTTRFSVNIKYITLSLLLILLTVPKSELRGRNGGISCAACTIITGLIEQLSFLHRESILEALQRFCHAMPPYLQDPCVQVSVELEPLLISNKFLDLATPDAVCYALGSCHRDGDNSFCHLFPRPKLSYQMTVHSLKKLMRHHNTYEVLHRHQNRDGRKEVDEIFNCKKQICLSDGFDFCTLPIVKHFCDIFNEDLFNLEPILDMDDDGYSGITYGRGAYWRGRDCDDLNSDVRPGVRAFLHDVERDTNCNGIYGMDNMTGAPYEQMYCSAHKRSKALIYIGDSIGAHFHFPRQWMDPNIFKIGSTSNILTSIMDELDWPHLGFATGFMNTTTPELIQGVTDSIYLKLRKRNRCNHRDYINLSQNAATVEKFTYHLNAVRRNKTRDLPALVLYGFMGNDVCNRFQDTIANMTTPEQMYDNVMLTIRDLERRLPNGSHIVLLGLVDGAFIYPEQAYRIHPLGSPMKSIRYKDLYKWFTCMEIGPCTGWMTPNVTLRHITSQRALALNNVLRHIAATEHLDGVSLHYLDSPVTEAMRRWTLAGHPLHELIDSIDSLHPNQIAQPLIAEVLWENLLEDLPWDVLGPVNSDNAKIEAVFGNQGGH